MEIEGWEQAAGFVIGALGWVPEFVPGEQCKLAAAETCRAAPNRIECSAPRLAIAARAAALQLVASNLGDPRSPQPWTHRPRSAQITGLHELASIHQRLAAQPGYTESGAWRDDLAPLSQDNGGSVEQTLYIFSVAEELNNVFLTAFKRKYSYGTPADRELPERGSCDDICRRQAIHALAPYLDALRMSFAYVLGHESKHAGGCRSFLDGPGISGAFRWEAENRELAERIEALDRAISCHPPTTSEMAADACGLATVASEMSLFRMNSISEGRAAQSPFDEHGASLLAYWLHSQRSGIEHDATPGGANAAAAKIVQSLQHEMKLASSRALTGLLPLGHSPATSSHLHPLTRVLFFTLRSYKAYALDRELCGEDAFLLVSAAQRSMAACPGGVDEAHAAKIIVQGARELLPAAARQELEQGRFPAAATYACVSFQ